MKYYLITVLLVLSQSILAQKEGNNWLFGNQGINYGLNFNVSPPALFGGGIFNDIGEPFVMSDPCGNLLFYSVGDAIRNKNNAIIINGDSLSPFIFTTGQRFVAVPLPEDTTKYYFFYKYEDRDPLTRLQNKSELRYGILDLSNGSGRVIERDKILYVKTTTGLGIVRHYNQKDWWILSIVDKSDTLLAFQVTLNGLYTKSIKSINPISGFPYTYFNSYIRVSPDSKKLVNIGVVAFISDFDNLTGKVTKLTPIRENLGFGGFVEFSPDSKKVYWSAPAEPDNINSKGAVIQLQIDKNTGSEIAATRYVIPETIGKTFYNLRLAPNKKIYIGSRNLDVLENPDEIGNKLIHKSDAIQAKAFAFPNNIAGFVLGKQLSFQPNPQCSNKQVTFTPQVNYKVVKFFWDFGDPASGSLNTSTQENPAHTFSKDGTFRVRMVTLNRCQEYDTLFKDVTIYPDPLVSLPDSLTTCHSQAPVTLSVQDFTGTHYQWNTGDSTRIIKANKTGWYMITASNPCNTRKDSVFVNILPQAIATIPDDTVFCEGNFKILDAQNEGSSYLWNTGETTRTIQIDRPGKYFVTITGACNTITDSANVVFIPEDISAFLPNLFTPNGDDKNESFETLVLNTPEFSLEIYNRWGDKVFFTKNYHEKWKGSNASAGVYYYLITTQDCKGNPVKFKGFVQLLR